MQHKTHIIAKLQKYSQQTNSFTAIVTKRLFNLLYNNIIPLNLKKSTNKPGLLNVIYICPNQLITTMKQFLLLLFCLPVFAQTDVIYNGEHINELDANNQKTGIWKVFDTKNNLMATCEFKDGEPVSRTRYYKDNKLILSLNNDICIIYKGNDSVQAKRVMIDEVNSKLVDIEGNDLSQNYLDIFKENNIIQPMYYGGIPVLYEYIKQNIDHKKTKRTKGKVAVKFNLDRNGFAENVKIISSTDSILNDEALRVIKSMPRWQPALQNGGFVRMQYTLPMTFN
ncbi:MAG: hypothetical protein DI539_07750 [Flavobacterium psychrophilum]|nr:MAG: hypothetical protein DI539_07750 [Flavobacterium psychrophilum]